MTKLSEEPRKGANRHGWRVVYISPEKIEDYNACYRVELEGQKTYPDAADDLGISMDEIWISEKLKDFEKYVLYHEIREIKCRAPGYDGNAAHKKAVQDEKIFQGDQRWKEFRKELNIASKDVLADLAGIDEDTFQEIKLNRPYHQMSELCELDLIDEETCFKLKESSWSLYQD